MAAGDTGLSAVDFSGLSDVAYSGLADSSYGFSGDSALESDVGLQDPLQLDTSSGETILSQYDLYDRSSPELSLSLSGVSDPPFASASASTPNPNGTLLSNETSSALGFFDKLGAGFASLVGGTVRAVSPTPVALSTVRTGYTPTHSVNGTTTAIIIIIVVASAILLLQGSE